MNGSEKIIAQIQSEAKAKAESITAGAQAKAAEITAEYAAKAKKAFEAKMQDAEKEAAEAEAGIKRLASMESRKAVLSEKQALVAKAFEEAAKSIASMPEDKYVPFLAGLAAKASETGEEEIVFTGKDSAIAEKVLAEANKILESQGRKGALKKSADAGSFMGGLVIRRENIDVNCTIEVIMENCRERMSSEVARILFS